MINLWLSKTLSVPFFAFLLLAPQLSLSEIYQWTDEKGKIHYSDRNPGNNNSLDVSAIYNVEDAFTIDIEGREYRIPLKTKGIIRNSVIKMGEILSDKLGVEYKDGAHVNVIIFGDTKGYQAYGGKKQSGGYYSIKNKEAVIRKSNSVDKTLESVIHETSHLLLSFNYGNTPRWLDEGLAEYFEKMKLLFSSVEIPPDHRWNNKLKSHLKAGNLVTISEYVTQTPNEWVLANDANDNLGYAYGWSLVFFLMSSEEGQNTLRQLFAGLKNNKKNKDYSAKSLDHSYPGGIKRLEKKWRNWIYIKKTSTYY